MLAEHMQGLELNPSTKKKEKVDRWRNIGKEAGKKKKNLLTPGTGFEVNSILHFIFLNNLTFYPMTTMFMPWHTGAHTHNNNSRFLKFSLKCEL